MVNGDKVILMTKLASYEEKEGKRDLDVGNYFRGDYVVVQVVKSAVCATITFAIIFGLYVVYDFENFMQDIYKIDLFSYVRNILTYYIITVVAYGLITYIFSTWRFFSAQKNLKTFSQNLKKLNAMYKEHRN